MKPQELPELKELPPNRTRLAVENALTLVVWAVWIFGAVHAGRDWRLLCAQYPALPKLLTAGAGAQALLLLALSIRARSSLRMEARAEALPAESAWSCAFPARTASPDLVHF